MPRQKASIVAGTAAGSSAAAGAPPSRKGTVARSMSIAPLALAVLAQVGGIGKGGGTGGAPPVGTQAVKCATGIADFQACHDRYATGCSQGGKYDGYLNSLKNQLIDPASEPQHSFKVDDLLALEKELPPGLTKANHEEFEDAMRALGEGEVAALNGYLYYAKDGGSESTNCLLSGPDDIDFHIGIGGDPSLVAKAAHHQLTPMDRKQAVIVEMTPHWRAEYAPSWSVAQLQKAVGRQVYVVGQLLADNEHDNPGDDCAHVDATSHADATGHCWRPTIWELHPVTRFWVCARAQCAPDGAGPGWTSLESFASAPQVAAVPPQPAPPGGAGGVGTAPGK